MYQAKMPETSSRCVNVVPSGVTFDSVKLNEWVPVTRPYRRNSVGVFVLSGVSCGAGESEEREVQGEECKR